MRENFKQILDKLNKPKNLLILANVLLVFFLILLTNFGVLPIKNLGDFLFFAFLVLIFALYRPGWSFLFFIGTMALENINVAPDAIGINIRPYQLFAGITLISVLVRLAVKRLNFELPKWKLIDWLLVIFAVSGFISALFSADRSLSLKQSIIATSFVVIYFLTRIFIQNLEDLKKIIPFFLSSSVVVVLYGIWQNVRFALGLNSFETMPGRPNSTFTEPDWLGIYLVFLLAVIYSLIYFFQKTRKNGIPVISNNQFSITKQFTIYNLQFTKNLFLISYSLFLVLIYILLILTVSRSAWVGAFIVMVFYLLIIFTNLKPGPNNWQWRNFLNVLLLIAIAIISSTFIVYIFHLTNFQLFNRAQSTGTGLQKITVACALTDCMQMDCINQKKLKPESVVGDMGDLNDFNCRHINLEDIEKEKAMGNEIMEIYRKDPNIGIRSQIYQKSWQEIKTHPVLGIGWGNIGNILGKDERGTGLNSSNIFLEVWLGSGILGLLAFITILFYTLIKSVILVRNSKNEINILGLFLLLGSFSIIIPNLFNAGIFLIFLWIFLGISNINAENKT